MDASSGEVYYQERLGAAGPYLASPVLANGTLYFAALNGKITVVEAGPEYKLIRHSKVDRDVYATPAIVGNSIYIRTKKHLLAYR